MYERCIRLVFNFFSQNKRFQNKTYQTYVQNHVLTCIFLHFIQIVKYWRPMTDWIICMDLRQWWKADDRDPRPGIYGASSCWTNIRIAVWPSLSSLDMRCQFRVSQVPVWGGPGGANTIYHAQFASRRFAAVWDIRAFPLESEDFSLYGTNIYYNKNNW